MFEELPLAPRVVYVLVVCETHSGFRGKTTHLDPVQVGKNRLVGFLGSRKGRLRTDSRPQVHDTVAHNHADQEEALPYLVLVLESLYLAFSRDRGHARSVSLLYDLVETRSQRTDVVGTFSSTFRLVSSSWASSGILFDFEMRRSITREKILCRGCVQLVVNHECSTVRSSSAALVYNIYSSSKLGNIPVVGRQSRSDRANRSSAPAAASRRRSGRVQRCFYVYTYEIADLDSSVYLASFSASR